MTCVAWMGRDLCGAPASVLKPRHNPALSFPWLEPQATDWQGEPFPLCAAHYSASFAPPTPMTKGSGGEA